VALSARRAMEPRASIDGFAPGPLVTRTGPREASLSMAEPVVRCRPGWRGAARRRGPVAAPYGHGTERAGPPFPPNGGFSSGRPGCDAARQPSLEVGFRLPAARRHAPPCAAAVNVPRRRCFVAWPSPPTGPKRGVGDSRCLARIRRPLPHPGLEAPLRLAFRASARTEPARGVAEGAERGLYLLDDPSRAVSDRGGSTIQAPLPLARLWACLYLAVRARVGSGRGAPSVLLFLC